ncbi:MAG TPA: branched-chain amino acid ABC transporter permease [Actinomycetota bacterium]|nr:branched-chain amino acid ABC transporter permease [Actinomycetota bacterium]
MATATGVYQTTYRKDFALRHTKAEYARLVLVLAAAAVLPFRLDTYWLLTVNLILLAVIAAVGLNILTGYTGLVSLATAGFLGVGAYATANFTSRAGLPMPVSVILATLLAAAIGAVFGLPALRLKGLYLAISTFAAQIILSNRFRGWPYLTEGHGTATANYPAIGDWRIDSDFRWYWLLLVITAFVVFAGVNLFRTGLGRAFVAIRDQDIAAEVMGVRVGAYKVLAFSIACGLAGLSGALQAHYRTIVTWENYELNTSFIFVAMIIVGGLGSISGAIYGAAFMLWLPAYITRIGQKLQTSDFSFLIRELPAVQLVLFGLVLVAFLLFEPRGLARLWQRTKDYFRLWPFRY